MKGPFRRLLFCSCICKNSSSSSSRQLFGHATQSLTLHGCCNYDKLRYCRGDERAGPINDPAKHPLRVLLMRESDKRRTQTQTHRQTDIQKKQRNIQSWALLCFALLCLIDCVFLFFLFLTIFCFCFVLFWWSFFFFFFFLVLVAAWFRLPAANPNPTAIKTTIATALHQFQLMRSSFVVWLSWCAVAAAAADHDHQRAIQRAPMHDDDDHHHRLSFFLSFFLLASSKDCKILPLPAAAPFISSTAKTPQNPKTLKFFWPFLLLLLLPFGIHH